MKRCLFILLIFLVFPLPVFSASEVGIFVWVKGRVDVLRKGQLPAIKAKTNMKIFEGDVIRTKRNGRAEVRFYDGSVIRIAPSTRVDITRYPLTKGKVLLKLPRGRVQAVVSKKVVKKITSKVRKFEIHTPIAVAGVRGTDYFVWHNINFSGVLVKEGRVEVYNPRFPKIRVIVPAGKMTIVRMGKPPAPPKPVSVEKIKQMEKEFIKEKVSKEEEGKTGEEVEEETKGGKLRESKKETTIKEKVVGGEEFETIEEKIKEEVRGASGKKITVIMEEETPFTSTEEEISPAAEEAVNQNYSSRFSGIETTLGEKLKIVFTQSSVFSYEIKTPEDSILASGGGESSQALIPLSSFPEGESLLNLQVGDNFYSFNVYLREFAGSISEPDISIDNFYGLKVESENEDQAFYLGYLKLSGTADYSSGLEFMAGGKEMVDSDLWGYWFLKGSITSDGSFSGDIYALTSDEFITASLTGTIQETANNWTLESPFTAEKTPLVWLAKWEDEPFYSYYPSSYAYNLFETGTFSAYAGSVTSPWHKPSDFKLVGTYESYSSSEFNSFLTILNSYNYNTGELTTYDGGKLAGILGTVFNYKGDMAPQVLIAYVSPSGETGILKGDITGETYYSYNSLVLARIESYFLTGNFLMSGELNPVSMSNSTSSGDFVISSLAEDEDGLIDVSSYGKFENSSGGEVGSLNLNYAAGVYDNASSTYQYGKEVYIDGEKWHLWGLTFSGSLIPPIEDDWYLISELKFSTSDEEKIFGFYTPGKYASQGEIGGDTYGYALVYPKNGENSSSTWIFAGEVKDLYSEDWSWNSDLGLYKVWCGELLGVSLKTSDFLSIACPEGSCNTDGTGFTEEQEKYVELGFPMVEVGKASFSGSDSWVTVNLNDVYFFAHASGEKPLIWASSSVSGTYSSSPPSLPFTVTLNSTSGFTGNLYFTFEDWNNSTNSWYASISGSGTLSGGNYTGDVLMQGVAGGSIGSGTFSGTASGVTAYILPQISSVTPETGNKFSVKFEGTYDYSYSITPSGITGNGTGDLIEINLTDLSEGNNTLSLSISDEVATNNYNFNISMQYLDGFINNSDITLDKFYFYTLKDSSTEGRIILADLNLSGTGNYTDVGFKLGGKGLYNSGEPIYWKVEGYIDTYGSVNGDFIGLTPYSLFELSYSDTTITSSTTSWALEWAFSVGENPLSWHSAFSNETFPNFGSSPGNFSAFMGGTDLPWDEVEYYGYNYTSFDLLGTFSLSSLISSPLPWLTDFKTYNPDTGDDTTYVGGKLAGLLGGIFTTEDRISQPKVYGIYITPSGKAGVFLDKGWASTVYFTNASNQTQGVFYIGEGLKFLSPLTDRVSSTNLITDVFANSTTAPIITSSGNFSVGGEIEVGNIALSEGSTGYGKVVYIEGENWEVWGLTLMGSYSGLTGDDWSAFTQIEFDNTITGLEMAGTEFDNSTSELSADTYGYVADTSSEPSTWILVGETVGVFDPSTYIWYGNTMGVAMETGEFLNRICPGGVCNTDGTNLTEEQEKLANLGFPVVEVGRTSFSGSGSGLTVNLNNVVFFAQASGKKPLIWATADVSGTYTANPSSGTTVTLNPADSNFSGTVNFTVKEWDTNNNNWMATVSGSGSLSGGSYTGSVDMEGAGAGKINPSTNSFSGTAAGIVK